MLKLPLTTVLKTFFDHENVKKLTSNLHIYGSLGFFLLYSPDCPKQPRIDNLFYRFLYPMICGTISGLRGVISKNRNKLWNIIPLTSARLQRQVRNKTISFIAIKMTTALVLILRQNTLPEKITDFKLEKFVLWF